jgi:hypothetical protein
MKRLLALVTVLALTAAPLASRVEAAPGKDAPGLSVPVSTVAGAPVSFNGAFRVTRFVNSGGKVFAQGVLTGIATSPTATQSIIRTVSMEVVQMTHTPAVAAAEAPGFLGIQAVCDILHLVLGPLHLNLLGLVVDLNQVVLDITGETGPGNLLGNLLCGITGILDGGNTNQIVALLNNILGIISGITL